MQMIPAGLSRLVDVVMYCADFDQQAIFDDDSLALLGIGQTAIYLKLAQNEKCRITITAYCDLEGRGDTKEFTIESKDGVLSLVASNLLPAGQPNFKMVKT